MQSYAINFPLEKQHKQGRTVRTHFNTHGNLFTSNHTPTLVSSDCACCIGKIQLNVDILSPVGSNLRNSSLILTFTLIHKNICAEDVFYCITFLRNAGRHRFTSFNQRYRTDSGEQRGALALHCCPNDSYSQRRSSSEEGLLVDFRLLAAALVPLCCFPSFCSQTSR